MQHSESQPGKSMKHPMKTPNTPSSEEVETGGTSSGTLEEKHHIVRLERIRNEKENEELRSRVV